MLSADTTKVDDRTASAIAANVRGTMVASNDALRGGS